MMPVFMPDWRWPHGVGLFLFTRILIPDAILTLTITGAIWAWLRLLDPDEDSTAQVVAWFLGASMGVRTAFEGVDRRRVSCPGRIGLHGRHPAIVLARSRGVGCTSSLRLRVALLIAVPWHVLATLRNPPYFAFSMHAGPGEYRGFFWFYFFNEHLLRFLNLRYPRDYNTVPRLLFWALNLVWLFPVVGVPARDSHSCRTSHRPALGAPA